MEWECGDTAVVCVCVVLIDYGMGMWGTLQLCVCGADRLWNGNVGNAAVVCVWC